MKKLLSGLILGLSIFSVSIAAHSATYSGLYVFGDSLSDAGDSPSAVISFSKILGLPVPGAPYFGNRFSNGPVAVEYLAAGLGLNDTTHFFDYAVGGATTGDMLSIVNNVFLPSKPTLDSNALFVVWGGANDFASFDQATADNATTNILSILGGLYNQGARHFLVPNMPILGIEPQYSGLTLAEKQAAVLTSIYFDTTLQNQIGNLAYASDVKLFNSADFFIQLALNASAAGLTNITDACFDGVNVCSTPDSYLFWDNLHPTAYVHALTGIALLAAVNAVPEPSSPALFLAGFIMIAVVVRRKRTTTDHHF